MNSHVRSTQEKYKDNSKRMFPQSEKIIKNRWSLNDNDAYKKFNNVDKKKEKRRQ